VELANGPRATATPERSDSRAHPAYIVVAAPGSSPVTRGLVVLLLSAVLAACAVKLPSPPPATDQTCILECQAQRIRCLQILGTSRSKQRKCADYLGACYDSGCKPPAESPQQSHPEPLFRQ
jgi:hypothetical protein